MQLHLPSLFIFLYFAVFTAFSQDTKSLKKDVDALIEKGNSYYFSNKDSLYFFFDEAIKLSKTNNNVEMTIESMINKNWASGYYYDLDILRKDLNELDSILIKNQAQIQTLESKNSFINAALYSKGSYYYLIGDYEKSNQAFNSIVTNINKLKEIIPELLDLKIGANAFLAKIYAQEHQFNEAIALYDKNIRIIDEKKPNDKQFLNAMKALLAGVLKDQKDYNKSNKLLIKALNHYQKVGFSPNRIFSCYADIIENHISLKQTDSVNFYLSLMEKHLNPKIPYLHRYNVLKSKNYDLKNNYEKALRELNTALAFIRKKWDNKPHSEIAEMLYNIGKLQLKHNKFNAALNSFEDGVNQFKNLKTSTLNQTTLLKILTQKSYAENALKKHEETLKTTKKAIQVLDQVKPTFKNHKDKLFLIEDVYPVFENGIEAAYNLYAKNNDNAYINQAFYILEKSKSALLLEALLGTKATQFANIPKTLNEKEQQLKSKIAYLEKEIDNKASNTLKDELFETKKAYKKLIIDFETHHKDYYNLKYNNTVSSIKTLQDYLPNNTALVSFMYGKKALYSIGINASNTHFKAIPTNKFENKLKRTLTLLNTPKSNIKELNDNSHSLYVTTFKNTFETLNKKQLIIIPDGLLNYIPFGSLNTSKKGSDYLLHSKTISYAHSATLLQELTVNKTNNKAVVFAPDFTGNMTLPHNIEEAKKVLTHFNGASFLKDKANLTNFKKHTSNYNILHLATHAIMNDKSPDYSYLLFGKSNKPKLYVKDIYNLKLNANLITLSACETGIGELKRGEGFMSLARSFFYSGAACITSSLWKINDASTSTLMNTFYNNLSKGETKAKALQNAKIAFIKNNSQNKLSHPYYWSGFIISGNTSAIATKTYKPIILIALSCITALTVFFILYRKQNRS